MATYIMLSRFSPDAFREPQEFVDIAKKVTAELNRHCPGVMWKASYATLGRFDVVDVVETDDPLQLERASMIIRGHGHSMTETLHATEWKEFLANLG